MTDESPTIVETESSGARARGLTRRRLLGSLAAVGAAAASGWALFGDRDASRSLAESAARSPATRLDRFAQAITPGGPSKDGIPPIDEPRFVAADQADFLADHDVVFGLVHAGEARAYPQLILVWHEICNDTFPDGALTVTYCPLTGSAVAFRGTAPGRGRYTFGTSGDLVNSNLLMYDRQTDSRWPQILGRAITGPARGARLEEIPMLWTTWDRWRAAHPDTAVLSIDTGAVRNYGQDPYGSYRPLGGYYASGSGLYFDVLHKDHRFDKKEVVIGVKVGDGHLTTPKDAVRERGVIAAPVAGHSVVVLHDPALDDARAFRAGDLKVVAAGDGRYADAASATTWDASGRVVSGSGRDLRRVPSYDVMWFAWTAFFPDTEVVT